MGYSLIVVDYLEYADEPVPLNRTRRTNLSLRKARRYLKHHADDPRRLGVGRFLSISRDGVVIEEMDFPPEAD